MRYIIPLAIFMLVGCTQGVRSQLEPVVMVIGDSVSKQWTPAARRDLCGSVVVQHESGLGLDEPEAPPAKCENIAQARSDNNGCAAADLIVALPHLASWHYNIIMFNAGIHDIQLTKNTRTYHGSSYTCGGPTPLDEYRNSLEQVAVFLKNHSDAVVFVSTTDVAPDNQRGVPAGANADYNQVMADVAREHGFYLLTFTGIEPGPHNIHMTLASTEIAGQEAAACIETVLQDADMPNCSR